MDKKEQNLRFFNSWAKTYDRSFLLGYWLRRMQADVVSFVEKSKGLKLLDVGCGTGELLLMLSEKLENPGLYGIDISKNMLMIAEKKLGGKALLKISDVESLPFKDNEFDYVITCEAFHHYLNQNKAINEMKRVLKDGGKLIIADVNFFFDIFHRIFEVFEPGCVRVNNRNEFIKMFELNGFDNIKQKRSNVCGLITYGTKVK